MFIGLFVWREWWESWHLAFLLELIRVDWHEVGTSYETINNFSWSIKVGRFGFESSLDWLNTVEYNAHKVGNPVDRCMYHVLSVVEIFSCRKIMMRMHSFGCGKDEMKINSRYNSPRWMDHVESRLCEHGQSQEPSSSLTLSLGTRTFYKWQFTPKVEIARCMYNM